MSKTTQHPASEAITAGLRRANALANCDALAVITRQFWAGYAKGLTDLQRGVLDALALRDASLQNIDAGAQGAWASLPIDGEGCAAPDVCQGLTPQSTQVAANSVAQCDVDTTEQFEHRKVAIVGLDDKHAAHSMDVCDGAGLHDASCIETGIVLQGGAV